jgi:RNA polymerase sigma-70 factor (ECF subfamily)
MALPQSDESRLISLAVGGDSDAFGILVERHLGLFHSGIRRILGGSPEVQDALQEALMSMHRALPTFEGRSAFSSWGYSICLRAALMQRRSLARRREDTLEPGSASDPEAPTAIPDSSPLLREEPCAHAQVEQSELRRLVTESLDLLPDGQRVVFVLRDLEDWDTDAIAAHLEITPSLVRQRLHRARMFLQGRLRTAWVGDPA